MFQIGFTIVKSIRDAILWKIGLVQRKVEFAIVGDAAGVHHSAGKFRERRSDFLR
jgi:hypothetical protein